MKKHIIQSIVFAIWKSDFSISSFDVWQECHNSIKEIYYTRAKAAIKEYKKLLKANGLEIVLRKR